MKDWIGGVLCRVFREIEGVTFEDEDFDVTEDIKALQESLHLLRNGGVTK